MTRKHHNPNLPGCQTCFDRNRPSESCETASGPKKNAEADPKPGRWKRFLNHMERVNKKEFGPGGPCCH